MANTDLESISLRLDRIERALSRLSVLDDLVNPVDPPPDDFGRPRAGISSSLLNLRLADLIRLVDRVDPPPFDVTRFRSSAVANRLAQIQQLNPGWFVDPPPEDFLNVRILDLLRRWRGGFTDPAPDDLANVRLRDLIQRVPGGGFTDPAPDDIGRLTKPEIEAQIHKINAEVVRLQSLERMLKERLGEQKE